jgi:hypothetical protein
MVSTFCESESLGKEKSKKTFKAAEFLSVFGHPTKQEE